MSTKNKRSPLAKIISEALAAGALVFLPVVTATASPATSVSSGEARVQTVDFKWPWENDDNRRDEDYGDDDYDGDDRYGSDSGRQTLYGEVTRDLGDDEFEVRLTNGDIVTVRTRGNQAQAVYPGVSVQIRGEFDNFRRDVFIADDVDIVRDGDIFNDNSNLRDVNFPATVLRVTSRTRLTVRGDNGRTYTVSSRDRFSASINQGDRVRIIGRASGGTVTATRVALLENNGSYNPDYGNGGYGNDPDYGNDPNFGQPINFQATVVSVSANRLTVKGDNGKKYFVTARNGLSSTLNGNDRVRIIGRAEGQLVMADQVRLLSDYNDDLPSGDYGRPTTGQTMNFTGTVRTVLAGLLTVRADDGQTYTVRYRGATSLRRGERVRVSGTFRKGVVAATSVRRF